MTAAVARVVLLSVLGAAAGAQSQTPPSPPAAGTNVLFGRLLDVGTDTPVGGAVVRLADYYDPFAQPALALDPRVPLRTDRRVLTTPDGYFVFQDLPPGRYLLAAGAFGYVSRDYPAEIVDLADSARPMPVTIRISKYATIAGRVADERGEPVVGIPVTALRRLTLSGRVVLQSEKTVETDDRGDYRLAELPPDSYVVAALASSTSLPASLADAITTSAANRTASFELRQELVASGSFDLTGEGQRIGEFVLQRSGPPLPLAPDGAALVYPTTLYPGTADPSEARAISLGSGESRTGVDLPLRFLPAVHVTGTASGPDGPLKHLTIRLRPVNGADVNDFDPIGVPAAVTDGNGSFVFLAVPPGDYVLRASLVSGDIERGEGQSLWAIQSITVGDTDMTGLSVTLRPGIGVSGHVEFKGLSTTPLPSASERIVVALRPVGSNSWRTVQAIVQPDGTFATVGDPPGRYTIYAGSLAGWMLEETLLGGRSTDVIELDAAPVTGLALTLSRNHTRVSGSVSDATGAPDPRADVVAFAADRPTWREGIFDSRRSRVAHVSPTGTFEMNALAPGEYYVAAIRPRLAPGWPDPELLERLVTNASRITLASGGRATVQLKTVAVGGK